MNWKAVPFNYTKVTSFSVASIGMDVKSKEAVSLVDYANGAVYNSQL